MADPYDLNRRQQRWANRLALSGMLEGTGAGVRTGPATRRLARAGFDPALAAQQGQGLETLQRISRQGALGGKRAKFLTQTLGLKGINEWEEAVTGSGEDQIAGAYQTMLETLGGSIGAGADMGSPAVLGTLRDYREGRAADTTRFRTQIGAQATAGRNAILLNQLAPTLDETGALVEALKRLREEEQDLASAQRASIYTAGLTNPLRAFGSAVGGAIGGRTGAAAGGQAAFSGFSELLSILQSLGSLGGGGQAGPTPVGKPMEGQTGMYTQY